MIKEKKEIHLNLDKKPETKVEDSYIRPLQSANVLFKFMNKLQYIKDILLKKAIIPRYYEEKLDYLNIDGIDKIAIPMSCFCDIHLNKLVPHMLNYGSYGIGLSKEWGIKQGIQPIQYLNPNSNLCKDFSEIFTNAFKISPTERDKVQKYNNYLLHDLFYMKPLEGEMLISGGKSVKRNFHDEKEWRFIPNFENVDTELPLVISQEFMNPKSYYTYSEAIRQCTDLWLNFEFEQIKHIIVSHEEERRELIEFVIENKIGDGYEQYLLLSKVIVFDELKEDW
ncbi:MULTISPECIES: abortive infection system antitoxin AbiGi family protein [Lysinibacillus]|uniref:abortive infection system antitoxin AbiGi family protein n=1 Tax=Lysinibacillus TaxID=400634 RepID=UPI002595EF82|nr:MULTISPECIES: abortive infection system antitoxin AbiGi family protein [Lysinibacillus]